MSLYLNTVDLLLRFAYVNASGQDFLVFSIIKPYPGQIERQIDGVHPIRRGVDLFKHKSEAN